MFKIFENLVSKTYSYFTKTVPNSNLLEKNPKRVPLRSIFRINPNEYKFLSPIKLICLGGSGF